jgi:hypothetical protein
MQSEVRDFAGRKAQVKTRSDVSRFIPQMNGYNGFVKDWRARLAVLMNYFDDIPYYYFC